MKRESVFLTVFLIILVASSPAALGVQRVEASGTVYIRADGTIDPPTVPMQRNGDLYTLTGNITSDADGIVIQRDSVVVDGQGYTVQGAGGGTGIMLSGRGNVTIKNTEITVFADGIWLDRSPNNSISGNNITDNNGTGIELHESSNYNSIDANTIVNNSFSIWLDSSSNNSIDGNNVTDNSIGIVLGAFSNNNSIFGNNVTDDSDYGIWVGSSSNNKIDGNTVTNNSNCGMWLGSSSKNSINRNVIANNKDYGIYLDCSSNNSIGGNTLADNSYGITVHSYSDHNSLDGNTITNNRVGLELYYYTSNNIVYHNNFINNTYQVTNWYEVPVFWDNGCEGNYWSNYNGVDLTHDGIADIPLPWEGVDNYPLMNVYWNPCDIDHDLEVNRTDIDISARAFGTHVGDALWNPHADITGPEQPVSDGKVDMRDISLIARHFGDLYIRHSTTSDPIGDQGTGPSYGDIMEASVYGPISRNAIELAMVVNGRVPNVAPLAGPTAISCFSWRFDTDKDPNTGDLRYGIGVDWEIFLLAEGEPGDPDPGTGTWSLMKWSLAGGYQPLNGTFEIIHDWKPGADMIRVTAFLREIGSPTTFNWIAYNTYYFDWVDYAPETGILSW